MPNTREKPIGRLTLPHYGGKGHYMKCSEQFGCSGECADCEELDKIVERLAYYEDMIANGVTVQKWIPVTERLPEHRGEYLVVKQLFGDSYVRVVSFAKDGRKISKYDFQNRWKNVWYEYDSEYGYITIDSVTHWMPLPDAPKGE